MKFSLQVAVPAVIIALTCRFGATSTPSGGIRRLDSSEAVTFQPNIGPCIDLPAGTATEDGSLNDGWSLAMQPAHNDDISSSGYDLGFGFLFFGALYGDGATSPNDKVFINNNGYLSFRNGLPSGGTAVISPFLADIDTRPNNGHVWLKDFSAISDRNVLAVTYENVGYYNSGGERVNSFQVLISDGEDAAMGFGNNVCFCYEEMRWARGGIVGVNMGPGRPFFQIGRFDRYGTEYGGPSGSNGVDYLDNKSFCFNAGNVNVPPVASGFPGNGVITLDTCGTLSLPVTFVSSGQTVIVAVLGAPPGLSASVSNSNQGVTDINIQFTPTLDATFNVTFAATDSASPPGTTTMQLIIVVSGCTSSTDQPSTSPFPSSSSVPNSSPTGKPSMSPFSSSSSVPSTSPTGKPSMSPFSSSSSVPSTSPTGKPSMSPFSSPSFVPSTSPTGKPSMSPSSAPSFVPSTSPNGQPSTNPSSVPSFVPSTSPNGQPSTNPSSVPSFVPSSSPSSQPSTSPSSAPSSVPSSSPSGQPSTSPSSASSSVPSSSPTGQSSSVPRSSPSGQPSTSPFSAPSFESISRSLCKKYAVHALFTVTFQIITLVMIM